MKTVKALFLLFFISFSIMTNECLGMTWVRNFLGIEAPESPQPLVAPPPSEQPLNFSWVIDKEICGMANPTKYEYLKWLTENNIGLVVTLIEPQEGRLPSELFKELGIEQLVLPIPRENKGRNNGMVPTIEQVDIFIKRSREVWVNNKKATIVHCYHGESRTGTILACWLVANKNMTPDQAIKFVREKRYGSASLDKQVKFVKEYAEYVINSR